MNEARLLQVLLAPCLTEKTSRIESCGQYVFRVASWATKTDIKRAVSKLFNVKVRSVNVLNVKSKRCGANRKRPGFHKGWKKAYVTLVEGQTINLLGENT